MSNAISLLGVDIRTLKDGAWELDLTVRVGRVLLDHELWVYLDSSVHVTPPALQPDTVTTSATASVSTRPVSVSRSRTHAPVGYRLIENKIISFAIPSRTRAGVYSFAAPIRFTADLVPERVTLRVAMRRLRREIVIGSFTGLYLGTTRSLRANLVDFLTTPGQRFLFAIHGSHVRLPYSAFSTVLPEVQYLPDSVVWGTTWPQEVAFWNSDSGLDFLAHQLRSYLADDAKPRRIAISPSAQEIPTALAEWYMAELEVQHRLGVDIRIVEPEHLVDELGTSTEALLCLGGSLAISYSQIDGPDMTTTRATLRLGDDVSALRDAYDAIQREGTDWADYQRKYQVSPQRSRYVAARLGAVSTRANLLSARALASDARKRGPLVAASSDKLSLLPVDRIF